MAHTKKDKIRFYIKFTLVCVFALVLSIILMFVIDIMLFYLRN